MSKLSRILEQLKDQEGTTMGSFPQFQHTPVKMTVKKKKKKDKDTDEDK